jgi:hypothetical protein
MREELVWLVQEFGSTHAEKSKLLHGLEYEIMATFGMSTSLDAAAIYRFSEALIRLKQAKLLRRLFETNVRYTLKPEASSIIRSLELPKHLAALFSPCQVTRPRTPTLKVRQIVSE